MEFEKWVTLLGEDKWETCLGDLATYLGNEKGSGCCGGHDREREWAMWRNKERERE